MKNHKVAYRVDQAWAAEAAAPTDDAPEKQVVDTIFKLAGRGMRVASCADLEPYLPATAPKNLEFRWRCQDVDAALRSRIRTLTKNASDCYDRGSLRVHLFAVAEEGVLHMRVQARRSYRRRPRYDWVGTRGEKEGEWWYGRLLQTTAPWSVCRWCQAGIRNHTLAGQHQCQPGPRY